MQRVDGEDRHRASETLRATPGEFTGMFTLLSAAEDTALPMNEVGWVVTVVGLLLALGWAAYVYR